MQHFFVKPEQIKEGLVYIQGNDVNHIKNVLRMKIAEEIEINDGNGCKYIATILTMDSMEVIASIKEVFQSDTELAIEVFLFQGLPKGDKMELIVEKSVELGVKTIIPVEMKRSIVKLDEKKKLKKVEKWNSVATSAAKQSARGVIPKVEKVMTFTEALEIAQNLNHVLVPYELAEGMDDTKKALDLLEKQDSVGVFIGPEGGFELSEIEKALEMGAKPISLGKRILRTETAGITALSILMYHIETK